MDDRDDPAASRAPDMRELVALCLSRMDREGEAAVEAMCAEHPDAAPALREAVARLHDLGLVSEQAAPLDRVPEQLGEFKLIRKIGSGGMGVVYLAHQQSLDRQVALKLIRPDRLGFDISRERFVREVETIARLAHPGIVQVYAGGEAEGFPYYAMEYLEGSALDEAIAKFGARAGRQLSGSDLYDMLPNRTESHPEEVSGTWFSASWTELALRMGLRVAEALQHAHERGVLHRDIKPSNIMVTRAGRVILLDFGLAVREDSLRLTRTGAVVGSLPYMAPEQHRSETVDARTDIYALGITLYELLTLKSPYLGQGIEDTRRAVLEAAAAPLRRLNPAVPRDVQTVVAKAMDKDPARRYASMEAFARDLRNLLELRPIEAEPPARWLRIVRWSQRRPAAAAGMAIATLSLLAGVPLFLWNDWRYRKEVEHERDVAVQERERAEAQAGRAASVLEFQRRMFRAMDPGENGRHVRVADVLHLAAQDIANAYAGRPQVEAAVRLTLGETYAALGLFDDAEIQLVAARERLAESPTASLRDRAEVDVQLGRLRMSQDQREAAGALLNAARAAYVEIEGEDSPNVGAIDLELSSLARANGDIRAALERARGVCERFDRTLGHLDRASLDAWGQYGMLLSLAGEHESAERNLRETITNKEQIYSAESPDLLVTKLNLATVLYARDRFGEAYDLAHGVREIQERVLGPDHAHTLVSLSTEASALSGLKDLRGAADIERDLWGRRSRVLGPEHADTLRTAGNLATSLAALKENVEAEALNREVLEKRQRVLGLDHWETGASHNQLASVLQAREEYGEAHEHLRQAVVCAKHSFTDDHWIVGAFLNNLGRCEINLARYADAERTLGEAYAALTKEFPSDHSRVQSAVKNYVMLYEKTGDEPRRLEWAAKLTSTK